MEKTAFARKIDNSGRLVIPSQLRLILGIETNRDYDFYIHEEDGKKFLSICVGDCDLTKAVKVIKEAGFQLK